MRHPHRPGMHLCKRIRLHPQHPNIRPRQRGFPIRQPSIPLHLYRPDSPLRDKQLMYQAPR